MVSSTVRALIVLVLNASIGIARAASVEDQAPTSAVPAAEIRVVDSATGRGVPLVELETVNSIRFVTDNAGRVAITEPALFDQELFFYVRSHGYESPKDGF